MTPAESRHSRWFIPALAAALYFSQGFPFGIVNEFLGIYLAVEHVSLAKIGFITGVGIAWTLKFLWSPLIDLIGTYRRWIAGSLAAIAGALLLLAVVPAAHWTLFVAAAAVIAFASATQDIAIDALTIRITPKDQLGPVNSARVAAYRVGMIAAGGGLAIAGSMLGWPAAFVIGALIAVAMIVLTTLIPANLEPSAATRHANPFAGVAAWLKRPGALLLLAVVLLYKTGDSAITPMTKPYWISHGFSASEVAGATSVLGPWFVIVGAIAGGAFVARFGLYWSLIWLGLTQNLSNVVYAVAASGAATRTSLYGVAAFESFTYGLGTAAYLAFLMSICDREHAATEYAMLTALLGVSRTAVTTFSGVAAERLGYAGYFWLTVALGIPGLLLVPLIRDRIRPTEAATVAEVLAD
jgi:PAT family beta-lactamase induction signal transducer AmpG